MVTFIKLCLSICRKNMGFTVGLLLMSILSAAIAFLGANFGASSSETVMTFINESGFPDVIYETEITSCDREKLLNEVPGAELISRRLAFDTHIKTENGSIYSVRVFCVEPSSPLVHTVHEETEVQNGEKYVNMSHKFAEYNGIHAGDNILLDVPSGELNIKVKSLVSNPETMNISKDSMSAYENYQFAYLYVPYSVVEEDFAVSGMANQWLVYFEKGISEEEKDTAKQKIREYFGGDYISETVPSESDAVKSINDDIQTINVLCTFIPGITWLISLGFGFIFIKIIAENQRKTIGLLRALGFSIRKTVLLFVTYTMIVNTAALIIGLPLGYILLRTCTGLIGSAKGITETVIVIRPVVTGVMTVVIFLIGILSALMSAGTIAGTDPCAAYGGTEIAPGDPPKFPGKMHGSAFYKISIASILRNKKRQIVGALCITACIISMCVGLEGVRTIGYPIDAVYGGRYRYDLMVRSVDEKETEKIKGSVTGTELMETVTFFNADVWGESVRIATLPENAEMTVLTDENGNRLVPGDGIIIEEMRGKTKGISVGDTVEINGLSLRVTGIAREILYPVFYVSEQTARKMGYGEANCIMIRLAEGGDLRTVEEQISEISDEAYFTEFSSQKDNIRNGFTAMRTVMLVLTILSFGIGSLLIINITILDFNENRTRYATLRALGTPVSRLGIVSAVQNLSRIIPGVIVAIPLSHICTTVLLGLLSNTSQQYVMVDYPACLTLSCLIPGIYVLLGSLVSLGKIRKMDFCYYLNEVE